MSLNSSSVTPMATATSAPTAPRVGLRIALLLIAGLSASSFTGSNAEPLCFGPYFLLNLVGEGAFACQVRRVRGSL